MWRPTGIPTNGKSVFPNLWIVFSSVSTRLLSNSPRWTFVAIIYFPSQRGRPFSFRLWISRYQFDEVRNEHLFYAKQRIRKFETYPWNTIEKTTMVTITTALLSSPKRNFARGGGACKTEQGERQTRWKVSFGLFSKLRADNAPFSPSRRVRVAYRGETTSSSTRKIDPGPTIREDKFSKGISDRLGEYKGPEQPREMCIEYASLVLVSFREMQQVRRVSFFSCLPLFSFRS